MSNEYFTPSGSPGTKAAGQSAPIRAQYAGIEAAFDKLPQLSTTPNRIWFTNPSGTGVTTAAGFTFDGATFAAPSFTGPLIGNASTATTLATPRAINGVNFDGSAPVTVTAAAGTLSGNTLAAGVTGSSLTGVGTITSGTWSGSFGAVSGANLTNLTAANIAAGTAGINITGSSASCTGNAATASSCSGNTAGTASNITAYTINQNVGSSNSPTFAGLTINGAITATGNITGYYSSDRKMKKNVSVIRYALHSLSNIRGVFFEWKKKYAKELGQGKTMGVIAQDVEKVYPEIVAKRPDGTKAVRYELLVPVLIEAIHELNARIKVLEAR